MPATKTVKRVKPSDPPTKQVRRYDWAAIAKQLRAQPGVWFTIFEGDKTSIVTSLRADHMKDISMSEFEVTTANNRRTAPRTCDLWMRARTTPLKGRK